MNKRSYKLQYLPLFYQDLEETIDYIANVLKSPETAMNLINEVEAAILKRLEMPTAYETYNSKRERKYPYYRIYVKNYIVFYTVIDDVMEVRRFLYGARDLNRLV